MEGSRLNRPRVSAATLPGQIPEVPTFDGEDLLDVALVAAKFLDDFQSTLEREDWNQFAELWSSDTWWKDSLTLTFDKRTLYGKNDIVTAWKELSKMRPVADFSTSPDQVYGMRAAFTRLAPTFATLDIPFAFSTANPNTRCTGMLKLIPDGSDWKIWILATAADHLEEFPFQPLPRKEQTVIASAQCGRPVAQGLPHLETGAILDAVVIGGNASGIGNTVMLQSIGVNVAVLDMELVPGGLWSTKRYESFRLHHSKYMSQLPMLSPSDDFDEYMSGKQLTSYVTTIVEKLRLPFFGGIQVLTNQWNETSKFWNVLVQDVSTGDRMTLRSRNIVMSNGFLIGNDTPRYPNLSNQDSFPGPVQHSSKYHNAKPYIGKKVVVVGAGNSAHDIAEDLVRTGAESVTILQKSPIVFISYDLIMPIVSMLYQGQMSLDAADFIGAALPTSIMRQMVTPAIHGAIQGMGDRNRILEDKGYMLEKKPDLMEATFNAKGSKFFMDHPNTYDLIVQDKIKIARGEATGFAQEGLVVRNVQKDIEEDEEYLLPAEGVVLATGYETIDLPERWKASGFLDAQSAAQIENVNRFGIDAEGEVPGFTTFSGHQHLYFSGIGFYMNRAIARYTAIQVMADVAGQFPERYRR